jgi:hypothetical protein
VSAGARCVWLGLFAAGCGGPEPSPHVRRLGDARRHGDARAHRRGGGVHRPLAPDGIEDRRRLALCRASDVEAVADAAGSDAGLGPGAPVLAARAVLLPGSTRARLEPERPLWAGAAWAVVVGKGLRDVSGRPVLDAGGRQRTVRHLFETGDLPPGALPRLSVTEALALAAAPEAGGEYAEVANLGSAATDLAGLRLVKRTASGLAQRCLVEPGVGGLVPAGGLALVAGGAWDGRYAVPPGLPIYRCGAGALLGGLADDRPVALRLETPGGTALSSLGWEAPAPRCATGPLERVHPAGPDAASNLSCPGTVTPGTCNASTPPEECPPDGR